MTISPQISSRDWFGKGSAGLLLGLALALLSSAMFAHLSPGGLSPSSAKAQLNMWLVSPIWCGIFSFCFLFHSTRRAWTVLGTATLLASALLYAICSLAIGH